MTLALGGPSAWNQERSYKQSYDRGLPIQRMHIVDRPPPGVPSMLIPRKYNFLKTARLVPTMVGELRNCDRLPPQQSAPQLPERNGLTKATVGVLVVTP